MSLYRCVFDNSMENVRVQYTVTRMIAYLAMEENLWEGVIPTKHHLLCNIVRKYAFYHNLFLNVILLIFFHVVPCIYHARFNSLYPKA